MPEPLFVVCWLRRPGEASGPGDVNDVSLFTSRERSLAAVRARVTLSDPRLGVLFSQGAFVRTDGVVVAYLLRKEVDEGRQEPQEAPQEAGEGVLSHKETKARCGGSCHACGERYEAGAPIVEVVLCRLEDRSKRTVRCHQACPGKG